MRRVRTSWSASAPILLLLAACGSAGTSGGPAALPPDRFEALYFARADSALDRYTAADVHFVHGMIAHHAQAVAMSEAARDRAAGPAVLTLAARIAAGQTDEIGSMSRWLEDRGQAMGMEHVHHPGMLTDAELEGLYDSRGTEFDRAFLALMIQHHEGALRMVEELLATEGTARDEAIFRLAADIQVDQRTEIARMRRMLAEHEAAGL